jgi:hemerythrin-like domain-containing protein
MDKYLNSGIKDVIGEFPVIESILEEYDIGCGPCMVGTCLLKDIVEIHRLPPEKERALMARIEGAIYPDRNIEVAVEARPPVLKKRKINYSPPMKMLVDEHVLIKRWLARIPDVVAALDVDLKAQRHLVLEGVDMIRSYADKYHHGKEEDILFKYFDDSNVIFTVIYEDHRQARQHVQAILTGIEDTDGQVVGEHLTAYGKLLSEHIQKEDEILFPWLDKQLSTSQVGELYEKFIAADRQSGVSPEKYKAFVAGLENAFIDKGVTQ